MKNAFTKAMALLVSVLFLCMVWLPQQALAVTGYSGHAPVVYDTDAGDATPEDTTQPEDTAQPDATTEPDATAQPDDSLVTAQISGIDDKLKLSPAESKLDSQLLKLARLDLAPKGPVSDGLVAVLNPTELSGKQDSPDTVKVYVKMQPGADFGTLDSVGAVEDTDRGNDLAVVNVSTDNLEALASLDTVDSVKVVHPPKFNTGSITSKGDEIINTKLLRDTTGKDGTGIKIGVISDGANDYMNAVNTHDLPDKGDPGKVTILPGGMGSGDEGTAMMEIVHDVAPGAEIYFYECGGTMLSFNDAVNALVDAHCTVICDDVDYTDDYFFDDGIISKHIEDLMKTDNILFVTAAGNMADAHYQGLCKTGIGKASDFRTTRSSTERDLYIEMPSGSSFQAVLQWNDPTGRSINDYDLYASPVKHGASYMDLVDCYDSSCNTQTGTQDPYETLELANYGSDKKRVALWVYNSGATANKTLEIYVFCDGGAYVEPVNVVAADSIFGHATVPGVIACAAIDGNPNEHYKGMSYGTIDYYSSRGPATMLDGSKRNKPDVTGVDGVRISGTYGFENPFYGTSAASPHVAAVAALLWSIYPSYKASQIYQLITSGAADMGIKGFDSIYGYGRVDAMAAAFYTVKFNDQGGPAVQDVLSYKNSMLAAPTQPIRTGYTFGGWYKEAACVTPWDFGTSAVSANMTLYAKWTINTYTVSFDSQGGSAVSGKTAVYNTTIPAPALPTFAGYTFGGWYKDAGFASRWNFGTDKVVDNITLFAKWNVQSFAVSFNSEGGSAVAPVAANYGSKIAAPADPSFPGHAFSGWYKDAACTETWDFAAATVEGNTTLFAKWTVITYQVTFDAQGGSGGLAPVPADYGTPVAYPSVPVMDGFYFGGWYTGTDFTRQWSFSHDQVAGDTTLYARWMQTPPAPVASAVSASYNSIDVSWDPVPYAESYSVSAAVSAAGPWTVISSGIAATGFTHGNLATNTLYFYKVQAQCTKDGNPYSVDSSVISAAPLPGIPASVSAQTAYYNSATITWSAVDGASGYEIWRSTSAAGAYRRVAATSSPHYTNKSLTTGTAYFYKVKAYRAVKGRKVYGAFSAVASARPQLSKTEAYAVRAGATSLKVSWGKVSGATRYEVWRAPADTGVFSLLTTTTRTYYTNTGLRTGQPYYYMIRAYRSSGKAYSAFSAVKTATP